MITASSPDHRGLVPAGRLLIDLELLQADDVDLDAIQGQRRPVLSSIPESQRPK